MTTEAVCIHAWELAADRTRDVPGKCRKCGEERTFRGIDDYFDLLDRPFSVNGRPTDTKRRREQKLRGAAKGRATMKAEAS